MSAYIYIVKCSDGTLYTGWTNDVPARIAAHNNGNGAKYTRSRRPVFLLYKEELPSKQDALRRECEIKRMTRKQKLSLIGLTPDIVDKKPPKRYDKKA